MMKEDKRSEYYDRVITWWIAGIMGTVLGLFFLYIALFHSALTGGA